MDKLPRAKIKYGDYRKFVRYDDGHFRLLELKRKKARELLEALAYKGIEGWVYGSIARGDIGANSDIDIFIPYTVPTYKIELALTFAGLQVIGKQIVMATPGDMIKAHLYLPEDCCITVPLTEPGEINLDFYKFGGKINLDDIKKGIRVPGVNKSLVLIIPHENGHEEINLIGNEKMARQLLGVGEKIIESRKRVLMKRDRVGRTGVFLRKELDIDTNFEEALKKLADRIPAVKRKVAGIP